MEKDNLLRRKDTTKGPPLRILSLDAGGVRGYSMLIIIQELMYRTYVEIEGKAPRRDQIPKPADHFDLIVGAGTGGLIAIMLGRLRLDIETCKEMYVRTTRRVFEKDKTFAGIPFRSTVFKASKLEEAIKQSVAEYTVFEWEGNDDPEPDYASKTLSNPLTFTPRHMKRPSSNLSVSSFSSREPSPSLNSAPMAPASLGNPEARLYDRRENRTKVALTAVYKGTKKGGQPALLRSYDSRKEPPPEFDCTIWQAGRATSAMELAFKPIQIGQSVFIDEGAGQFNPAPVALDEACVNEWPSREVGVFISIGTGKRPVGNEKDAHLWYEGFLGEFAEARKRIVSKIEGCEGTHQYMIRDGLAKRGVNIENYYRFNVEVGVGEFGINEWNRLADISTSTRRYLGKYDVQRMNCEASIKLAKIHRARMRIQPESSNNSLNIPEAYPLAVELPADVPIVTSRRTSCNSSLQSSPQLPSSLKISPQQPSKENNNRQSFISKPHRSTISFDNNYRQPRHPRSQRSSVSSENHYRPLNTNKPLVDCPVPQNSAPTKEKTSAGDEKIAIMTSDDCPKVPMERVKPPPLPPKLFIQNPSFMGRPLPPYPLDDEPPPVVNMARKPDYKGDS
ncbi:hypothetical protein K3495_g7050 [Podosphaera aphanis]|nr:hypothetical protein K3495_g7050 [Podosphaera aphanis]